MPAKAVDPKPDALAAHDHAALGQKVLDVRRAQSKTVPGSDGIGNDLPGKAKALQARHG